MKPQTPVSPVVPNRFVQSIVAGRRLPATARIATTRFPRVTR
ncbi:hypothetical protein ABLG96_03795 [Nakamurella sp. A5-74]|uniref:Uncharacterized protein n=1 Tax=Nakamurella sp. A5-74 TaxID=3158264 RepID=A0AAU8DQA8_9ACTN